MCNDLCMPVKIMHKASEILINVDTLKKYIDTLIVTQYNRNLAQDQVGLNDCKIHSVLVW